MQRIDWQQNWDAEVGLWTANGGHTAPIASLTRVHPGPNASTRLLAAAQLGVLHELDVTKILSALRRMQVTEPGPHQGCLKWYWEEPAPVDTNAAFFIGQSLVTLRLCFYEQFDAPSRTLLDDLLAGLRVWFDHAAQEPTFNYPNKFLGDLVCGWLLHEIAGPDERDGEFAQIMLTAADYWQQHGWGWGEHMSDVYARVCLDELSLLLLLAKRLPSDVRMRYEALFADLLAIEDQFDNGPRVPAIRSYAFTDSPNHINYRERIKPMPAENPFPVFGNQPDFGYLFHTLNWHQLAPPRKSPQADTAIPCFGGAVASGHLEADARLGSMSRYPIMPSADHPTWGLSWQSFPVTFWRNEGDWGYLQWGAQENGAFRAHPTADKHNAYLLNALTQSVRPPIVGRTFALQQGGNVLALRIMPAITASWELLCDRFRLVNPHADISPREEMNGWSQLLLRYPERTISAQCLTLTGDARPALSQHDNLLDWELRYSDADLAQRRMLVTLWGFSLDGEVTATPELLPHPAVVAVPRNAEERAWHLRWSWPTCAWDVLIDPFNTEPIRFAVV